MKLLFLLPPSEGKNSGGEIGVESLNFDFRKPIDIAVNASEKDLKCSGKRYEEGIYLNKNIDSSGILEAIERYSGVMYNAIDYSGMSHKGKLYFEEHFMIMSGMYGILKPRDIIGNYKLPIETKGLYNFWGDTITQTLNNLDADYIVDMLPGAYAKMIDMKSLNVPIVRVNFLHYKDGELKKITHGVKKVKGLYVKDLCEKGYICIDDFEGEKVQISDNEYHINIIS